MYCEPQNRLSGSLLPTNVEEERTSRLSRLDARIRKLKFLPDLLILATAFTWAYLLRFDFRLPQLEWFHWAVQLPLVVAVQLAALYVFGIHRFIWRYVGLGEVYSFAKAAVVAALPILALRMSAPVWLYQLHVPLSVIFMDTLLAFGGVLALRVVGRAVYETNGRHVNGFLPADKKPVLLIGAGHMGMLAAKEIQNRGDTGLEIKGFIANNPAKIGLVIQGVSVLGTLEDLPRLTKEMKIDHVVVTIAHASRQYIRQLMTVCEQIPIKARIVPGLDQIVAGNVEVSLIRDLQIEDLLGRQPVLMDKEGMSRFLVGKTVMVTGAGGSIGSELVRQVARFKPANLLLVERAEFSLFNIDREARAAWPELSIIPLLADIGDEPRMRSIFNAYRPQVVLHAAAHKHVPMMEANVCEVVKNNTLATHLLGQLTGIYGAEVFVLISTDKAVRPTSVMGASKRLAELVTQSLNQHFDTRYSAVRFGNVIGSAGSVIPIFRDQILKGGPITVTHPDMVRYFMTIPEAAQLVLQTGTMTGGGEIFVLDMGEPVRILDLVKDIITLSGLKLTDDIDIVFTGLRPGEKLFEELQTSSEHLEKTRHPKIFIGKITSQLNGDLPRALDELRLLSLQGRDQEIRRALNALLPEAQLALSDPSGAGAPQASLPAPAYDQPAPVSTPPPSTRAANA